MSVIVKDLSEKTIYVLTKGAESSLEKSIVEDDSKLIAFHHVEEFASSGLRTLGNHYIVWISKPTYNCVIMSALSFACLRYESVRCDPSIHAQLRRHHKM